tara:strand:- start:1645 stop:1986 length:342 start_codon:yes stop_codon:yes gene_type:complete
MLCAIPGIGLAQNYILWNGGVGADERELAPSEGTRLVFFVESGSFLAGVEVTVKDMQGNELVNTLSNGPWLILDLPEGKYQVNAQINENNAQGGLINVDNSNQEFAYKFSEEN